MREARVIEAYKDHTTAVINGTNERKEDLLAAWGVKDHAKRIKAKKAEWTDWRTTVTQTCKEKVEEYKSDDQ